MTATTATDPVEAPADAAAPPTGTGIVSRFGVWLISIAAFGFVLRVVNVLWWRPTTDTPGYHGYRLWGDAFYYHWQANALAKGIWFIDPIRWVSDGSQTPSAGHPPLYSTYLALWSAIGLDGVTAHRLASCVLGTASIVVIGLLGRRIGGNATGLVAAGIAAVYPQIWISDGMVMSETMAIFTTAVALTAAYHFWENPTLGRVALLGAACGLAGLTRSELVALFPLVVIPLALFVKNADWRRRAKLAVVGCVVGGAVLAPWVLYNYTRFEEPTTMTGGTGAALSAASCDEVWYGTLIGYYANCFQGPWPSEDLDESQRDVVPREQAIQYTKDHIKRLPLVVAARVGRLWGVFKPGQTTAFDWSIEGRGRAPTWIGLFAYYALVPFAIFGFVVLRRRRIPIIPLLAIIVIATISAAITFGVTRYRSPAEVAIVLAASIGITTCWSRWRRGRRPATAPPAPAA